MLLPAFAAPSRALPAALLAAILLAPAVAAGESGDTLTVSVSGLHSTRGQLVACLWKDKSGFPSCEKSKTALRKTLRVTGSSMVVSFAGLAPGDYAVTIHHDENADGKMQRMLGMMPREGVGVSNNPGGMPRYAKSLTTVDGQTAISVTMRYLFD